MAGKLNPTQLDDFRETPQQQNPGNGLSILVWNPQTNRAEYVDWSQLPTVTDPSFGTGAIVGVASYTGDGSTTTFALPVTAVSADNIQPMIDGMEDRSFTYQEDVPSITFADPPANGIDIYIRVFGGQTDVSGVVSVNGQTGTVVLDAADITALSVNTLVGNYDGAGSGQQITLSNEFQISGGQLGLTGAAGLLAPVQSVAGKTGAVTISGVNVVNDTVVSGATIRDAIDQLSASSSSGVIPKAPVIGKTATPPGSPSSGNRYIIDPSATGAWSGHNLSIATWSGSAWTFEVPANGWIVLDSTSSLTWQFNATDGAWVNIAQGGGVTSAFGRVGAITAQSGDYTADQVTESGTRVFVTPADKTAVEGATSAATASKMMVRDGSGRAQVAAPSAGGDITNKTYVDTATALLTPLTRQVATGNGLLGGGALSSDLSLSVNFGGNGSATTVARSDHTHTGLGASGYVDITASPYNANPNGATAGSNDVATALASAATAARSSGLVLLIPKDCRVGSTVDLTGVSVLALGSIYMASGATLLTGGTGQMGSTGRTLVIDFQGFVGDGSYVNTQPTPFIKYAGKNGIMRVGRCPYIQIFADGSSSSNVATSYNQFQFTQATKLEVTAYNGDGSSTGWINENTFSGGRCNTLTISDTSTTHYKHNNNHFNDMDFESGWSINIDWAHSTTISGRFESSGTITLGANTSFVGIERRFAGQVNKDYELVNRPSNFGTVSDSGFRNSIFYEAYKNIGYTPTLIGTTSAQSSTPVNTWMLNDGKYYEVSPGDIMAFVFPPTGNWRCYIRAVDASFNPVWTDQTSLNNTTAFPSTWATYSDSITGFGANCAVTGSDTRNVTRPITLNSSTIAYIQVAIRSGSGTPADSGGLGAQAVLHRLMPSAAQYLTADDIATTATKLWMSDTQSAALAQAVLRDGTVSTYPLFRQAIIDAASFKTATFPTDAPIIVDVIEAKFSVETVQQQLPASSSSVIDVTLMDRGNAATTFPMFLTAKQRAFGPIGTPYRSTQPHYNNVRFRMPDGKTLRVDPTTYRSTSPTVSTAWCQVVRNLVPAGDQFEWENLGIITITISSSNETNTAVLPNSRVLSTSDQDKVFFIPLGLQGGNPARICGCIPVLGTDGATITGICATPAAPYAYGQTFDFAVGLIKSSGWRMRYVYTDSMSTGTTGNVAIRNKAPSGWNTATNAFVERSGVATTTVADWNRVYPMGIFFRTVDEANDVHVWPQESGPIWWKGSTTDTTDTGNMNFELSASHTATPTAGFVCLLEDVSSDATIGMQVLRLRSDKVYGIARSNYVQSISNGGSGNSVGDILTGSGFIGRPPRWTVTTVSSGAITGVSLLDPGEYQYWVGSSGFPTPQNPVETSSSGTGYGAKLNIIHEIDADISSLGLVDTAAMISVEAICESSAFPYISANTATIVSGGTGYAVGDTFDLAGLQGDAPNYSVKNVTSGVVTEITKTGSGSVIATIANPVSTTTTSGSGSGCTLNIGWASNNGYDVLSIGARLLPEDLNKVRIVQPAGSFVSKWQITIAKMPRYVA